MNGRDSGMKCPINIVTTTVKGLGASNVKDEIYVDSLKVVFGVDQWPNQ